MKKILIPTVYLVLVSLFACTGNESKETAGSVQKDSRITADSTGNSSAYAIVSAAAVYDPNPTDTIPADSYGINSSSEATASLVRVTLKDELKNDLEKNLVDSASRKFIFFEYDLNDDGKREIFVGLMGSYFCGSGGCTQYILDNQGNVISIFSVSDYPVVIDNGKTNGWKNLFIHSGGKDRIAKFDGRKYPSNPSTLPALKVMPADDLTRALNFINEPYPWFKF